MRPQPLIVVHDVEASSRWYCALLGGRSGHGGKEYERVLDAHDTLVLQLHAWDVHAHSHLGDPGLASRGNGVLRWFEVDDFDAAVARARALGATVLEEPHRNPNAGHREIWLGDLDGYVVVLASAAERA